MKKIIFILLLLGGILSVYAQDTTNDNPLDETVLRDTGRLLLREISVSTFDDPTVWRQKIPFDLGTSKLQRIQGGPLAKEPLRLNEQINDYNPADEYILGVRFDFYGRDYISLEIEPKHELFIPGIVKKLSFWVSGRGKQHQLFVILSNTNGQTLELPAGKLDFSGWSNMEVVVPIGFNQKNPQNGVNGVYFESFKILTDFNDTVGAYYIYLDDMRAVSDVIDEVLNSSPDDISDGW